MVLLPTYFGFPIFVGLYFLIFFVILFYLIIFEREKERARIWAGEDLGGVEGGEKHDLNILSAFFSKKS